MACKKKLHRARPKNEPQPIQTQRTHKRVSIEAGDPLSLERGVRQLLADKMSGNLVGLWLLIPEHLRLGTWDLLCGWSGQTGGRVEPRLALQLVHEAALCTAGFRQQRSLSQRGFELANGLPFVGSDSTMHALLADHTVAESQRLQVALGRIRRASGDFQGQLLAIDPHRIRSYSKRQMRRLCDSRRTRSFKAAQTFFALDPDTHQPVCFTSATSSCQATTAAIELLGLAEQILTPRPQQILVMADIEHLTAELFRHVQQRTPFELLVPMKNTSTLRKQLHAIPDERFTRRWAGLATMTQPYRMTKRDAGDVFQLVQRSGEQQGQYHFKAFLSTTERDEVETLTGDYPKRWHVEEFFNAHQALGWNRAGTMNLNIRYGQMTMALLAQAALHQLRRRLGEPYRDWDAAHFAKSLLAGLEGDIRVHHDTIVVTYYNAPNTERLREHYTNLPDRLKKENINPQIPWLYGFKLDFRFR